MDLGFTFPTSPEAYQRAVLVLLPANWAAGG